MASVLRSGVQLRQRLPQQPSGFLAVRVAAQQHALGERQLVAVVPRHHVQVDVEHALERGLAVVDDDVVAVGVQPRLPGCPRDALPDGTMPATVSGGVSVRSTVWRFGTTRVWPRVNGRMSRIAR